MVAFAKTYNDSNNQVEENDDYSLIQNGEYEAVIEKSESKATKKGGGMLVLTLRITGPKSVGRKLFDNLNLKNDSEQAVKIAERTLASIRVACGVAELQNSEQLHGIPMTVTVGVEKGVNGYNDKNKIKSYKKSKGGEQQPSVSAGSAGWPDDYLFRV